MPARDAPTGATYCTLCSAAPRPVRSAVPNRGRDAVARRDPTGPPVQTYAPQRRSIAACASGLIRSTLDSRLRARRTKINGGAAGFVGSMARKPMKGANVVSERPHVSISVLHKQWAKLEDEHHQLAIAIGEARTAGTDLAPMRQRQIELLLEITSIVAEIRDAPATTTEGAPRRRARARTRSCMRHCLLRTKRLSDGRSAPARPGGHGSGV